MWVYLFLILTPVKLYTLTFKSYPLHQTTTDVQMAARVLNILNATFCLSLVLVCGVVSVGERMLLSKIGEGAVCHPVS